MTDVDRPRTSIKTILLRWALLPAIGAIAAAIFLSSTIGLGDLHGYRVAGFFGGCVGLIAAFIVRAIMKVRSFGRKVSIRVLFAVCSGRNQYLWNAGVASIRDKLVP